LLFQTFGGASKAEINDPKVDAEARAGVYIRRPEAESDAPNARVSVAWQILVHPLLAVSLKTFKKKPTFAVSQC